MGRAFNAKDLQARIQSAEKALGAGEVKAGAVCILLGEALILAEGAGLQRKVLEGYFADCRAVSLKDASEFKASHAARVLAGDLGALVAFDSLAGEADNAAAGIGRASWKVLGRLARDYKEAESAEVKEGARLCFLMACEDALILSTRGLREKYIRTVPKPETSDLEVIREKLSGLDAEGLRVVAGIVAAKVKAMKAAQEAAAASNGAEVPADVEAEREAVAA